ncbi:hypothetical protein [Kitasatospora sp. LaBMicrA B282]|uniref:5'-methylthioadenosine/S-adenosylhomocysteine nucleosidase family protein n=1 Tax=Kitasatospora sp. LaBMicrA B282 TaxID=3420949 RepID=UPI003D138F0F
MRQQPFGKARRVGVIVPLGEEFEYVRAVLPPAPGQLVDGEQYHGFRLPQSGVSGFVRVLSDMGQAPAALTADRMINRLGVSLVVLIGTGAGLDGAVRLGDVVVADQIQEHLRQAKVVPGAGAPLAVERAGESWRTDARLIDHVRNFGWLPAGAAELTRWRQRAAARRPGSGPAGPAEPQVHVGALATGDVVVAAGAFARWIRQGNRKLVALDMEAGGAALAAHRNAGADLLVIRGISDHADEQKATWDAGRGPGGARNAWRHYAVHNAAEYLVVLLSSSGFPWREGAAPGGAAAVRGAPSPWLPVTLGLAGEHVLHADHAHPHPDHAYPDHAQADHPDHAHADPEHADGAEAEHADDDQHLHDVLDDW